MEQWLTVKELMEKHGKPRSTIIDKIKRDKLETKKEEREVTQKQLVTVVKVEGD